MPFSLAALSGKRMKTYVRDPAGVLVEDSRLGLRGQGFDRIQTGANGTFERQLGSEIGRQRWFVQKRAY